MSPTSALAGARTVAYVANAESRDIAVLALDAATGELAELQRFDAGGSVMPLAVSPDRRVLHASIRSEPYRVLSLSIDPRDGRLGPLGSAPLPASMCWVSTDRSGRWLLAASYGASLVSVSRVDAASGAAREAVQVVATAPHAHSIQVDPSNRFAFAASLGGDVVHQYRFDAEHGRLGDNEPPAWRASPKSGPRHFAFHPTLPRVYLLGELDAGIDVLAFDRERGVLDSIAPRASALPPGFDADAAGPPWAADLHVTADGRFLYASERRTHTLAAFAIDPTTGGLQALGSVPTETQPRGFALTPDGRFLLAAGQVSHRLSRHAIDAGSGRLTKLGDLAVGRDPNWIEVVELPG